MPSKITIRPRRLAKRLRLTLLETRDRLIARAGEGVCGRASIRSISPETLADRLRDPSPLTLIYVGSPALFARGHIPRSSPVPLPDLVAHLDPLARDTEIFLYCGCAQGTLGAAGHGAERLIEAGFKRLRTLDGHLKAWRAAGRTVEGIPGPDALEGREAPEGLPHIPAHLPSEGSLNGR